LRLVTLPVTTTFTLLIPAVTLFVLRFDAVWLHTFALHVLLILVVVRFTVYLVTAFAGLRYARSYGLRLLPVWLHVRCVCCCLPVVCYHRCTVGRTRHVTDVWLVVDVRLRITLYALLLFALVGTRVHVAITFTDVHTRLHTFPIHVYVSVTRICPFGYVPFIHTYVCVGWTVAFTFTRWLLPHTRSVYATLRLLPTRDLDPRYTLDYAVWLSLLRLTRLRCVRIWFTHTAHVRYATAVVGCCVYHDTHVAYTHVTLHHVVLPHVYVCLRFYVYGLYTFTPTLHNVVTTIYVPVYGCSPPRLLYFAFLPYGCSGRYALFTALLPRYGYRLPVLHGLFYTRLPTRLRSSG